MGGFNFVLLVSSTLAGAAIAFYWWSRRRSPPAGTLILCASALLVLGASIWIDRPVSSFKPDNIPISIVVAFDLSPSMLAIPDPNQRPEFLPRYVRARNVLQKVFGSFEERRVPVNIALIGFTSKAEILMGWDKGTSQLREILDVGLSPGLFTSSGTNLEAAVTTIVRLFDMLPVETREASQKIVIIVSDGEDTTSKEMLRYAIDELSGQPFQVVSLHVGLSDANEGVPRYDHAGEFLGFEAMSGNTYSTPDAGTMRNLSRSTAKRGLFVRAEQDNAVQAILAATQSDQRPETDDAARSFLALSLFLLTALVCIRVL